MIPIDRAGIFLLRRPCLSTGGGSFFGDDHR